MTSFIQKNKKLLEIGEVECGEGIIKCLGHDPICYPHWKHYLAGLLCRVYFFYLEMRPHKELKKSPIIEKVKEEKQRN